MIYTLTLNPAIDHIVRVDDLKLGQTNRMIEESISAGGKGINVSKILNNLGKKSVALGFLAGFTGKEIERMLDEEGIESDFIRVNKGFTRINVKIKANQETEINGPGLQISEDEENALFKRLASTKSSDTLFLSGSIPKNFKDNFYRRIMFVLSDKKIKIAVDTVGQALLDTLEFGPFLIKPNKAELEDMFKVEISDLEGIEKYAKKLQEMGARNIIVSLGGEGGFFLSEDGETMYMQAVNGKVVDTVGAGDSMVAGFMYAIEEGYSKIEAFKFSMACGAATAFSDKLGTKKEIFEIYKNL